MRRRRRAGRWAFAGVAALVLGSAAPPPPLFSAPLAEPAVRAPGPLVSAASEPAPLPAAQPVRAAPAATTAARPQPRWAPPPSPANELVVHVDLAAQRVYLIEGGKLVESAPVSSGKRGHETPTGTFRVMEKDVDHRSNKYSNAPMPFMQRLTSSGVALHAGHLPGYPASHGCIRLPWGFAKRLFAVTRPGTRVVVTRSAPRLAARPRTAWRPAWRKGGRKAWGQSWRPKK